MSGHGQPDGQEQHDLDLLDQHIERVGQQALEGDPALAYGGEDAAEPGLGQHHAGGGLGDIRRGRDGDPDLGLAQGRRIVGAIAAHADDMAMTLKGLDQPEFLLGHDAGEDAELLAAQLLGKPLRRANGAGNADLAGNRCGGDRRIPRDHDRAHAHVAQRGDERRRIFARRIAEGDEPGQAQSLAGPTATAMTRCPCPASSSTAGAGIGGVSAMPAIAWNAPLTTRSSLPSVSTTKPRPSSSTDRRV